MQIKKLKILHLESPLSETYHLAFGDLSTFSMILAIVESPDGKIGIGEATACPGYSSETFDSMWAFNCDMGSNFPGSRADELIESLMPYCEDKPFAVTPLVTSIEMLLSNPRASDSADAAHEIIGTINSKEESRISNEVEKLVNQGYKTLKLKVGWDTDEDIKRTLFVQKILPGTAKLRIDANQGFNLEAATEFVRGINKDGVELFEQPFPTDKWGEMEKLSNISSIPLMLDESIHSEQDLDTTIALKCAKFVKFKLMKIGSVKRLEQLIKKARQHNLGVILGNGVSGEIGCFQEAQIISRHLDSAGENNGFLKQKDPLLKKFLSVKNGQLIFPDNIAQNLDLADADAFVKKTYEWD